MAQDGGELIRAMYEALDERRKRGVRLWVRDGYGPDPE
jgi:hypothetical protein